MLALVVVATGHHGGDEQQVEWGYGRGRQILPHAWASESVHRVRLDGDSVLMGARDFLRRGMLRVYKGASSCALVLAKVTCKRERSGMVAKCCHPVSASCWTRWKRQSWRYRPRSLAG